MTNLISIVLLLGLTISVVGQNKQLNFEKQLVDHFKNHTWGNSAITRDSLNNNPFKSDFNVSVSDNYLAFDTNHGVIKNPYFSDEYEDSEDDDAYVKNFPRSYSVIYKNTLVSLFEKGKFGCFKLGNLERDLNLEQKLNTKRFKYHWIIDNQLGGLSGSTIYVWNGDKWVKSKSNFPLKNQPKLFEDKDYIVYHNCRGEWGGGVYFFEKSTSKVFFTAATCANSVIKRGNEYVVLSHLGHGAGFSKIKSIPDPRKLTPVKPNDISKTLKGKGLPYKDKSEAHKKELDFYGVLILSSINYLGKTLYVVYLSDLTFLAEIKNNEIEIVHPLFMSDIYTHNPVTSLYDDYTLINLDHVGYGGSREISVLIFNGKTITKVDWNEKHRH